jgi:hypothetical protein
MSVVTFRDFVPPSRYDEPTPLAWITARIEEAATAAGPWTTIDTITLDPVDADPTNPQVRNLTTENASAADGLWYRIVFVDATGDEAQPTEPLENTADDGAPFATVQELARILKIRTPTSAQTVAMTRVLTAAAGEIRSEIDLDEDSELAGWQLYLVAEVNLERAVEHWQQQESPFGIIGLGAEFGATHTARDSWERHAHKLAPLKGQWGIA